MLVAVRALLLGVPVLACGTPGGELCAVSTEREALVGGASEAGYLGLSAEQASAVASLEVDPEGGEATRDLCTAVLLGPDALLTAGHCIDVDGLPLRIGFGQTSEDVPAERVRQTRHPSLDLIVLQVDGLQAPYSLAWTDQELASRDLDLVEVAGAGLTGDGSAGAVMFAVARARVASDSELSVELAGEGGPCGGDSGGPLLLRGATGAVEVAGILSRGSPSCRGPDIYLRLDRVAEWLSETVGERRLSKSACDTLGAEGRCFGRTAVFCENGLERSEDCGEGFTCGWEGRSSGYRCLSQGEDPCDGVTDLGSCAGEVARRCSAGILESLSCEACGARCAISSASGKAVCS